jgi:uncharacterized membrane protein
VLGVVFSLTVVVLQIASAQFTPRVMRNLTGDRGTQVVLGVFLGTFTYALIVLRAVRSPGENGGGADSSRSPRSPSLSCWRWSASPS